MVIYVYMGQQDQEWENLRYTSSFFWRKKTGVLARKWGYQYAVKWILLEMDWGIEFLKKKISNTFFHRIFERFVAIFSLYWKTRLLWHWIVTCLLNLLCFFCWTLLKRTCSELFKTPPTCENLKISQLHTVGKHAKGSFPIEKATKLGN